MKKFLNEVAEKIEWLNDLGGMRKAIGFLCLSGVSLILSLIDGKLDILPLPFDVAWVSIILCGLPIIAEALVGLVTEFNIKSGVLVSIALVASVFIGEDFAAGEVAFIMQLGELLEHLTVERARSGIEKLVDITPQKARVMRNGTEELIPSEEVKVGDILRVLPGDSVPVDGVIISGQSSINQAVMTGESLPIDKAVGDEVFSGTSNQFGSFEMRATKVGDDSSVQRMIKLVKSADARKSKIVGIADRWATVIVFIAIAAAAISWAISGEIIRAVTILVVFCPCALVLATPTAIMAAIGAATKRGFLVREGSALERLSKVNKVAFDKTGTLTLGTPKVAAVETLSEYTKDEIYAFAAAAEQYSEHPLGRAIVRCYEADSGKKPTNAKEFTMTPGEGITAVIDKKIVRVGNEKLVGLVGEVDAEKYLNAGNSVIYLSIDGAIAGYIALSDTLREDSHDMIDGLRELGITPVLLTGDNKNAAGAIGNALHIDAVRAECLPEDKLSFIKKCQADDEAICMIGDGINDAPALKMASVGIAMGGVGSDIAVEAADIALVDDNIKELPTLFALSRKMMTTIKLNMIFSMSLNFLAIALAMTGILNPVVGALVHNAGSVAVIINSALLLTWKKK